MKVAYDGEGAGSEQDARAALAAAGCVLLEGVGELDAEMKAFREEHGIKHEEESTLDDSVPDEVYADIARPHHYDVPATLYVRKGRAVFKVKCEGDKWARVEVDVGDLLHLPPGARHTFERDTAAGNELSCLGLTTYDPAEVQPEPTY